MTEVTLCLHPPVCSSATATWRSKQTEHVVTGRPTQRPTQPTAQTHRCSKSHTPKGMWTYHLSKCSLYKISLWKTLICWNQCFSTSTTCCYTSANCSEEHSRSFPNYLGKDLVFFPASVTTSEHCLSSLVWTMNPGMTQKQTVHCPGDTWHEVTVRSMFHTFKFEEVAPGQCNALKTEISLTLSFPVCSYLCFTDHYNSYCPFPLPTHNVCIKIRSRARCRWLTPIIIATQEAEIRRIVVQSQPRQ
jgi:hypothetical protein